MSAMVRKIPPKTIERRRILGEVPAERRSLPVLFLDYLDRIGPQQVH